MKKFHPRLAAVTTSAALALALHVATTAVLAETINLTGANGTQGTSPTDPGVGGGNGGTGESLARSTINTLDADKTITLLAGAGGTGGSGASAPDSQGGSGGNGGFGGDASGSANATLDTPEQKIFMTLAGGAGGHGGSIGGSGTSLAIASGGNGRAGGDASGDAMLTAGPSTTKQTANLSISSGSGGYGANGWIVDPAQTGGSGGIGSVAGQASGTAVMRGSLATVNQTLTANIQGGGSGVNGTGAGVPQSVNPNALHPLNAEGSFDLETPANNANINVAFNISGGGGGDREGVVEGGKPPSHGQLNASRIEASGTNTHIAFSGGITGGTAYGWIAPSGPGVVLPGGLGSGGRGATPIVDGVELIAGTNGSISGALVMAGGSGGSALGTSARSGKGANVAPQPGILRATSLGGSINLQMTGTGGSKGFGSSSATDGIGGHATVVNSLAAQTPSGSVTLNQTANGGNGGGRAISSLEHIGTTTGFVSVTTRALGGGGVTFSPPELALNSTLGSARATTIVKSLGNQTEANAIATGRSNFDVMKGADADATVIASGPGSVIATAVATGSDAVFDGAARAFSSAEVTRPGAVAHARAATIGFAGQSEAVTVAPGDANLPVTRVTARFKGEHIASNTQQGGSSAASADVPNSFIETGISTSGSSVRANAFDAADPEQLRQAVTVPFSANPAVPAFFSGFPNAKHLVSGRAIQRSGAFDFTGGRIIKQHFSGTLELAPDRSGGQLVFSGLGFATVGGGFDSMTFTFRQNGVPLVEQTFADAAEAGAFFTNQVTSLADLALADSHSVFSWEIIADASTSTQFFDASFLLSATASSGLVETLAGGPVPPVAPQFSNFSIGAPSPSAIDPGDVEPMRISGLIVGPVSFATVILETSNDLGLPDSWQPLSVLTTDGAGEVSFDSLPVLINPEVPQAFFRARTP